MYICLYIYIHLYVSMGPCVRNNSSWMGTRKGAGSWHIRCRKIHQLTETNMYIYGQVMQLTITHMTKYMDNYRKKTMKEP